MEGTAEQSQVGRRDCFSPQDFQAGCPVVHSWRGLREMAPSRGHNSKSSVKCEHPPVRSLLVEDKRRGFHIIRSLRSSPGGKARGKVAMHI